jgi:creatinine amidohydrolase
MLHLAPQTVRLELAERRVPERLADNRYVRFGGPVSFGWTSADLFDDGYIGDPSTADAEHGKRLFEQSVRAFCEALREVAAFDFGR